ncbi:phosphatidate cytidylyltransferase [Skermanella pratensis]|uniref:phosphatidate cytidylyltransferase n=1 Tax=Skermanella pratensis TaxID=2233999 RepID=UPI001301299E|nr:phosphatidate cytidylyltransferase [Skermanella pratensis]
MQSENSTSATGATAQSGLGRTGNLRTRIISALVLGPVVLLAVYLGGWVFEVLILTFAVLAVAEWTRLVEPDRSRWVASLPVAAVAAVLIADFIMGAALSLLLAAILTVALLGYAWMSHSDHRWLFSFGIPYIVFGSVSLIWVRGHPEDGLGLLIYLLFCIWATDIGAYAAGKSIGGPKLAPRISPKKTWAGLIGGMLSAAAFGAGVAVAFDAERPWLAAVLGMVLAVVGQIGDLFESGIKRRFDVKDSGRLIPGHGGLLDRVDGLIVAAPVFALFHATLGKALAWW